ncbi:ferredoxin--NADP reductase [Parafrankia sp. FMc6]|uniref:2Fe-2S iron-sulfur cluster-binding protein n=1 Tax=Parafrankia soli TaxID=2599596 RepID=UPI0034D4BF71
MAKPPLFQRATVTRTVRENADTRTFVLAPHGGPFTYRAGQFCVFRVRVGGEELLRSYSMSSAPETDAELMTTVKRVPGRRVSNWLIDNVAEGDELEVTSPRGTFCLRDSEAPLLGFCGGSGITPLLSLTKSALADTGRQVRLLCADRDRASMVFEEELRSLVERYPGRLTVVRHVDTERGLVDAVAVRALVGSDVDADCYLCGPEAFMDLVAAAIPGPGRVFAENFGAAPTPGIGAVVGAELDGKVTVVLRKQRITVPRRVGETLLESARRGGLNPPFICESGTCGTCIATIVEGAATMRNNEVLTDEEVAEGYILTCQGVPGSPSIVVRYE